MFKILFAPLQGYTTGIYRKAHAKLIGGIDAYYAPFLRIENGKPRLKDLHDLDNESTIKTVPQIIANSVTEFKILANALQNAGFNEIDLNMGCPYPMQVNQHRGAGLLNDISTVKEIFKEIEKSSAKFSLKIRLGHNTPNESFALLPLFNDTPLNHITIHPRLGKQQYKGVLDIPSFEHFYNNCTHTLYFNGDITTVEQINELENIFPNLAGVMVGRGLLANPFLAIDYKNYVTYNHYTNFENKSSRLTLILKLHETIMDYACKTYKGDTQILSHLHSFWEYLGTNIPKKILKKIKKSTKIEEYLAYIKLLEQGESL